jgi:hypothetical protein
MVHIKVNIATVNYNDICSFYNNKKEPEWNTIHMLDRAEGGFCIPFEEDVLHSTTDNSKIKQVRWNRKCLITPGGCYKLSPEEITLLHQAMVHVHGEENIVLESGPFWK